MNSEVDWKLMELMFSKWCDQRCKVQLINFHKAKHQVLDMVNNLKHWYRIGAEWVESCLARKNLKVLKETPLAVTWQYWWCVNLPRKSVESPTLEIIKTKIYTILGTLLKLTQLWAGDCVISRGFCLHQPYCGSYLPGSQILLLN